MKKRNFIFFLSIILIISMLPVTTFAEDLEEASASSSLTPKTSLNEAVKYNNSVYLAKDVSYSGTLGNNSGSRVTIDLNSKTLSITDNSALYNLVFKNGTVRITGSGISINNVEFNNDVTVEISGNGNTFCNNTQFSGNVTLSGEGNTFNYVIFNNNSNTVISGQSNTFRNSSETNKTIFYGELLLNEYAVNNTFDRIMFTEKQKTINGKSRFVQCNFNNTQATITDGEYDKVVFSNVNSSNISNGEFNKVIFEYGSSIISGGIFNDVKFDDDSTEITAGKFYNPVFYNSKDVKISDDNVMNNPVFYERENPSTFNYDIIYNEGGTIKTVSTNTSISDILISKEIMKCTGAVKIILKKDIKLTKSIEIGGNQNVIIDLNGHKLTKDTAGSTIVQYGSLIIMDSSNKDYSYENDNNDTSSAITIGKGYIDSIHIGSGTLLFRAGSFSKLTRAESSETVDVDNISDLNTYIDTRSSIYRIDGKYYVIYEGNMDYSLSYKIFDKNGDEVKSSDNDAIQDISIGEKYTVKVYLKSNTDKAVRLRGFDINMEYCFDGVTNCNINVETPYSDSNKYYSVVKKNSSTEGVSNLEYRLNWSDTGKKIGSDANYYIPAALTEDGTPINDYEGLMIAQFEITVDKSVEVSQKIRFEFKGKQTLAIMKDLGGVMSRTAGTDTDSNYPVNMVSVNNTGTLELSTKNYYDGVTIANYRYAPEGYLLAIVAKEHRITGEKEYTVAYDDGPMWYTTEQSYINQSTNPKNIKADGISPLGGVYLKLISPEALVKEGLLKESRIDDTASIAEAVEKKLYIIEGKDSNNNLNIGNFYNIDGDSENRIDYNDASLVYQMLQDGGARWGYDPIDTYNYLNERSRLIAATSGQGKLYGTIEDVARIINNYSSSN